MEMDLAKVELGLQQGLDKLYKNIKRYNEDGFIVLKDFIDVSNTTDILHNLSTMLPIISPNEQLKDCLKKVKSENEQQYISILRAFSRSLSLFQIFGNENIIGFLSHLGLGQLSIPTQPVLHMACKDLVIDGGYFGLEAHQDWPSIVGSLNSVIVWIPLTTVGEKDHPMQVVPGSHLTGVISGSIEANGLFIDIPNNKFVDLICDPGDVVIMSTFCVHRTKAIGDGFRIAASMRFNDLDEEDFRAHGFPCAYSRSVDRSLFKKYLPETNKLRRIFSNEK